MIAPPKSSAGVEPGQVLAGKYRIERVLGVGGMGVVVAAHHIQLDEPVALKFLVPEALQNPESVARFAREARAAVKIKSELRKRFGLGKQLGGDGADGRKLRRRRELGERLGRDGELRRLGGWLRLRKWIRELGRRRIGRRLGE